MIDLIARKDFLEFKRDGRLFWAGGVAILLILTSMAVGWQRQREASAEQRAAQELDYSDWLRQEMRHPHDAAHQGMHVFKPEPTLTIIDPGIGRYAGTTVWLQAHRQSDLKFQPAQDATGLQRFGDLSAAWVLQVLGPLLVIVFGFGAFAGEREQGTLRQTLSLGVSARRLLWGKALALGASIGTLLFPAVIAAVVAIGRGAESGTRLDAMMRLGWVATAYAVYFGIIIFLVLAVSAVAPSSRMALMALLAVWIVSAVMAPRVVSDFSRRLHPTPAKQDFLAKMNAELSEKSENVWQENFGVKAKWSPDLPLNKWGVALRVDDEIGYEVFSHHYGQLWDTFERQRRVQEWTGLIAPLLALRSFSMGMSGSDFAHHRHFTEAAEAHRHVIQDLMSEDLVRHADTLDHKHFAYQAGKDLWTTVPPFRYSLPGAGWAFRRNWPGFAVLAAGLLLSFAIARAAVSRLRVVQG